MKALGDTRESIAREIFWHASVQKAQVTKLQCGK